MYNRKNAIFTPQFQAEIKELNEAMKTMTFEQLTVLLSQHDEISKRLRWKLAQKTRNPRYYITLNDECVLRNFQDATDYDTCEGCSLFEKCQKLRSQWEE